jgi:hypothetical protein
MLSRQWRRRWRAYYTGSAMVSCSMSTTTVTAQLSSSTPARSAARSVWSFGQLAQDQEPDGTSREALGQQATEPRPMGGTRRVRLITLLITRMANIDIALLRRSRS